MRALCPLAQWHCSPPLQEADWTFSQPLGFFLFIFNLNLLFTIQTHPAQVTKASLEGLPCFRDQPNTSSVFTTLIAYILQQPQAGPQKGC